MLVLLFFCFWSVTPFPSLGLRLNFLSSVFILLRVLVFLDEMLMGKSCPRVLPNWYLPWVHLQDEEPTAQTPRLNGLYLSGP